MKQFIRLLLNNKVDESVFWEPCAFGDLIATCYGGVTRKVVAEFAKSKKVFFMSSISHLFKCVCISKTINNTAKEATQTKAGMTCICSYSPSNSKV